MNKNGPSNNQIELTEKKGSKNIVRNLVRRLEDVKEQVKACGVSFDHSLFSRCCGGAED